MMDNLLAARYARAIGEIGQEKGTLDRICQEMEMLADITMPDRGDISEPELLNFLNALRVPLAEKIRVTDVILEKMNFTAEVSSLLNILLRRRRVTLIGGIANNLRRQVARLTGVLSADLESARGLSPSQIDTIRESLESSLKRKVVIRTRILPGLIGGIRIRMGDKLIDASVTGRLERLENSVRK